MPLLQEYFFNRLDDLYEILGGLGETFIDKRDDVYVLRDPDKWLDRLNSIESLVQFKERLIGESEEASQTEKESNEEG